MLRIYGTIKSRTVRVLWMAEELALPYELVPVDYNTGQMTGLNVAAVLAWARAVAAPLSEFPLAAAWLDRCLARPAYRRIEAMRREAEAISLPTT